MSDGLRRLTRAAIGEAPDDRSASDPTVVGVLLAGGRSTRFGDENKLLARIDGEPLVRRAARTLREARVPTVVAVLGHQADAVRSALDGFGLCFVRNPDYGAGISTSVRAGVRVAEERDADAAVFLPGDMPFVDPSTIDLLVDAHRSNEGSAIAAGYEGRRGNPVLFDRQHFPALRSIKGDVGGRRVLLESDRGVLVETGDPGTVTDIDRTEDLERFR